jgi:nucleotide-binding universal stress UspA family protein
MCTYTGQKEPTNELGHVAMDVLHQSPCPVVLVPPARGQRPLFLRHVLMPHDGTPTTAAAAEPAMEFADHAEAELIVLHVAVPGASQPAEPGSITSPMYVDQVQYEWPAWVHEFLERARCCPERDKHLRFALRVGRAGVEIVRFARDNHVDLIVLGWHGSWEGEHAGAIKDVIRDSPCPILLFRVGESRPPDSPPVLE